VSTSPGAQGPRPSLNKGRRSADQGSRLKPPKHFPASNLRCTSQNGRSGGFLLTRDGEKQRPGAGGGGLPPWLAERRAQARNLWHQNLIYFFLRALIIEVKPFFSPSATATIHERSPVVARFSRAATMAAAAPSDALAPRTNSTTAVDVLPSPPSGGSDSNARVQQIIGGDLLSEKRLELDGKGTGESSYL
jgi:hypothetical protein